MSADSMIRGSGFQFEKFSSGGKWKWTVWSKLDQSECLRFYVSDIETPWGHLTGISAPIPSDVIAAMQESTQSLSSQFLPAVAFVDSSQSALPISVAEGDSETLVASVSVVNSGAFGSFATFQASVSAPWLRVTPTKIQGIHKNGVAEFDVFVRPSLMLSASSPYSGLVVFSDGTNSVTSTVTAQVAPRPAILVDPTVLAFSYNITTTSTGPVPTLRIENSGSVGSSLDFAVGKVQNTSPWLSLSASSGSNVDPGDDVTITFTLNSGSFPTLTGVYTEILRVSSPNASNSPILIPVTFTVTG